MTIKIGINGLGRIGRMVIRSLIENNNKKIEIKHINSRSSAESSSSMGTAFKMSTELVSAVVVGTIIGFILDNWFGTKPWLILIFFFVGVIAGIMNVVKSAKKMQLKVLN